jgi:hypothetical protein
MLNRKRRTQKQNAKKRKENSLIQTALHLELHVPWQINIFVIFHVSDIKFSFGRQYEVLAGYRLSWGSICVSNSNSVSIITLLHGEQVGVFNKTGVHHFILTKYHPIISSMKLVLMKP